MSELSLERQDLIRRIFWYAADNDYICARLAARHALYRHFAWNAAQCLEKNTKCIIVLAGGKAKFSHKFSDQLRENVIEKHVKKFPNEIDISSFTKVREGLEDYAREAIYECIERFEKMGNSSVRYNTIKSQIRPYDLQKLDRLVFLLRRLCIAPPLDKTTEAEHAKILEIDHYYTDANDWPTVVSKTPNVERKRDALKFENVANFPEIYNNTVGWFFAFSDEAPQTVKEITGRMSEKDMEWLKKVAWI